MQPRHWHLLFTFAIAAGCRVPDAKGSPPVDSIAPVTRAGAAPTSTPPEPIAPWYAAGDSSCPEGARLITVAEPDAALHTCERDGRWSGPFSRLDAAGNRRQEGWLERGLLHRTVTEYSARGVRLEQVSYSAGVVHGHRTTWHETGSIASRGYYGNGLPHGEWVAWHRNGQRREYGRFAIGRPHGRWTYWDESGVVTRVEIYARGTLYERRGTVPDPDPDRALVDGTLERGVYVTASNLARILPGFEIRESIAIEGRTSRRTYVAWYRDSPALEIAPTVSGGLKSAIRVTR